MAATNCRCGHHVESPVANELGVIDSGGTFQFHHENLDDINALPVSQNDMFCQRCATRLLVAKIARYKAAIETHRVERIEFRRRLLATRLPVDNVEHHRGEELSLSTTSALPDPNQINQQVFQLRQKLDKLRSLSNELAIRVTSKTVENDERQENLESNCAKVDLARKRLDAMRQFLLMTSDENSAAETAEKKHAELSCPDTNVGGGLRDALVSGTRRIRTIRFHFALRVFEMHRIDVGEENSFLMIRKRTAFRNNAASIASGVGKIGGLPLPHAGPALYGVLPPGMLASSLRLVASLTNLLARCLGVVLPHPILVCSSECIRCSRVYDYNSDVIDTADESSQVDDDFGCLCSSCDRYDLRDTSAYQKLDEAQLSGSNGQAHRSANDIKSSLLQNIPSKASFLSFVGTSARRAMAIATGSAPPISSERLKTKSIEQTQSETFSSSYATSPSAIARRISYASFAVLLESNESGAAEYVLNPPRWKEEKRHGIEEYRSPKVCKSQVFSNREEFHVAEEKFGTGLQLLQNDVIALCFRAGVDASTLWPAESVLLNLYSLLCHCIHVVGLEAY